MAKLSHFFVPHKKNNYRAHFLKPIALYTIVFGLLALQFSFLFIKSTNPSVLGISYSISVDDVIAQTNDERGKAGLSKLQRNGPLTVAAQLKGSDMLAKGYWAHISPDGKEPWFWIAQAGYSYNRAGENLAKDFRDTISVTNAWMASPGHRANILNANYKEIGVAVVSGPFNGYDTVIVVQMFGEPFGSGVANSLSQPQSAGAQIPPTPKPAVGRTIARNLEIASTSATTEDSNQAPQLIKPEGIQTTNITPTQSPAPLIDPVVVFKYTVFVIGMFFIILLGIDGYVIAKKRVQRSEHGHSLMHAFFLAAIMISLLIIETGVIL
ncbi:MAG: CAP domain-containing protein [bacterium]|nr:CAP domain-containing protein [bacterium]